MASLAGTGAVRQGKEILTLTKYAFIGMLQNS